MTVRELIEALQAPGMNPDALVVLAKDAEGNGYSPASDIGPDDIYVPESTWNGEIWPGGYDPEYFDDREHFEHVKDKGQRCVTLWPVN